MSEKALKFDHYQEEASKFSYYIDRKNSWYVYPLLGLCGEVGEVEQIFKKAIRDEGGVLSEVAVEKLKDELGDVLWYLNELTTKLGSNLNEIARLNLEKLAARQKLKRVDINAPLS